MTLTPWTCPECGNTLHRITMDKQPLSDGDWLVVEMRVCVQSDCDYATVADWWWESPAVHEMGRETEQGVDA